ncbi:MAG: VWA domain-containing protein [Deltaproteobacteria bacterium]|nr:VWA domain-containing protein [Deltaproteobacteria bacterium]
MEVRAVKSDGYDRDLFAQILAREPAVAEAKERAARLLPQPEALLHDLFAVLFKLNVEVRDATEVAPSALINRRLVQAVQEGPGIEVLRARTALDEHRSAAALVALTHRVLDALTRESRVVASELMAAAEAAQAEEGLDEKKKTLQALEDLGEAAPFDPEDREKLQGALRREVEEGERALEQKQRKLRQIADDLPLAMDNDISGTVERMPDQMDGVDQQLTNLGLGAGGEGRVSVDKRLELGERLARSKKLQLLARLTGAFREVAFEARRKRVARAPQELHEIKAGAELNRLLPSELLGLSKRRRALHLDFLRRLTEGELLQYDLHAPAARGPMVVCVDGSGSMQGSKEIWAKAVALTLMEVARRERRRCLAVVFSGTEALFEVELLGQGRRGKGRMRVLDESVLRFAEHFPGGGTNFEAPLRRALAAVAEGAYRRGDIVFITDGEASVSDPLVADIKAAKKKHRFAIRSIEVDVAHSQSATLERFSDEVRKISDLTADSLADLFAAV